MKPPNKIGIDVGGTKIAAVVFGAGDEVLFEARLPTPKHDYEGVLRVIAELADQARHHAGSAASIGIGIPGSVSPASNVVQNANSTWMNGRDFQKDIEVLLKQPVRVANDANCLALSEAHDGAGQAMKVVFAVIIGTGCGGAIVVDKKLLTGRHAIAGEWGHTPLPWPTSDEFPAPVCWCGRSGCLEQWVSGSGLESDFEKMTGKALAGEQIVEGAEKGDTSCKLALENHSDRLARGLAMVTNILDPDVIVLGGGLSNMPHLYKHLPQKMSQYIFADHFKPVIKPAVHGDASGVRGAARLWDNAR